MDPHQRCVQMCSRIRRAEILNVLLCLTIWISFLNFLGFFKKLPAWMRRRTRHRILAKTSTRSEHGAVARIEQQKCNLSATPRSDWYGMCNAWQSGTTGYAPEKYASRARCLQKLGFQLKDCNNMNSKVIIEAVPLITMMNLEMIGMITDHILEKVILIPLEALLMVKEIVIDLFEALVIETMM